MSADARERLVRQLREAAPVLDDISRARMERGVLDGLRARTAPARPRGSRGLALSPHMVWAVSLLVAAGIGAAAVRLASPGAVDPVAHFEVAIGEVAVQSGVLQEGQTLESRRHGRGQVSIGDSRIELEPRTRLRFDALTAQALSLALGKGAIEVSYHPVAGSGQQLRIATRAAQVEVVGTEFRVDVGASGRTRVRVHEGVVRVTARFGGEAALVHAGQEIVVPAVGRGLEGPNDSVAPAPGPAGLAATGGKQEAETVVQAARQPEADTSASPAPSQRTAREAEARASAPEAEPGAEASPATPPSHREQRAEAARKLEAARNLLYRGKHAVARRRLRSLAASHGPAQLRAEALTLLAESYAARGAQQAAAKAYRRAAFVGRGSASGDNAVFALARLLERSDRPRAAAAAYRRYLHEAPRGALAGQATRALCRLGEASSDCASPSSATGSAE